MFLTDMNSESRRSTDTTRPVKRHGRLKCQSEVEWQLDDLWCPVMVVEALKLCVTSPVLCQQQACLLPPGSRLAVAPYLAHKLHIRAEAACKGEFSYNMFSFTAIPTHTNTNLQVLYRISPQISFNYLFHISPKH
jgi:hypothetical protein